MTQAESEALRFFADESGFDGNRCVQLHVTYFEALVRSAWEDGVLAEEEREQVAQVGALLGVDPARVAEALSRPPASS